MELYVDIRHSTVNVNKTYLLLSLSPFRETFAVLPSSYFITTVLQSHGAEICWELLTANFWLLKRMYYAAPHGESYCCTNDFFVQSLAVVLITKLEETAGSGLHLESIHASAVSMHFNQAFRPSRIGELFVGRSLQVIVWTKYDFFCRHHIP